MSIYSKLVRKHLLDLKPYSSARDEYSGKEGIFLDANENPYGSVAGDELNRYPDPYQWEIKNKLAGLRKTKAQNIFLGNGSDEAIDLLIKSLCEPGLDNMIILPPTYGMYQVCADIQQIEVRKSNLDSTFQPRLEDIESKIDSQTKIIWVCSPNNPSGNVIKRELIESLLTKYSDVIIVVDEAYIDFTGEPSFTESLDKYENLVVMQTFSKAWGMAGLRVGMAFAHEDLIAIMNKIKYPYNLNIQSQRIVLEALNKVTKKEEYVKAILSEKKALESGLEKLSMVKHIYPSDSNQLLVKFEKAHEVFKFLMNKKIIVRDRSNVVLCDDCLRITIGTHEENQALLEKLAQF